MPPHGTVRVVPLHFPANVEPDPGCIEGDVGMVLVCAVCLVMGAALRGICDVPVPEFM